MLILTSHVSFPSYLSHSCLCFLPDDGVCFLLPAVVVIVVPQSLQMWLKSDRGEIEVYLCPEDDGSSSPRSASSIDEGKGESVSAGSTFDSKSALDAATRSPHRSTGRYASRSASRCATVTGTAVLRPEETEAMKYAFISEDDDMGTIGSTKSYLMMSESDVVAAAAAGNAAAAAAASASGIRLEPGTSGNSNNNNSSTSNNNMSTPAGNVHHNAIYLSSPSSSSSSSPRIQQMPVQSLVSHPLILSAASANSSPTGSLPFLSLEPPLSEEDYNFALEASEGIADLFDEDLLLTSS